MEHYRKNTFILPDLNITVLLHEYAAHEIQFCSTTFFGFFFFRIRIRIRIPLAKSMTKVMLCALKIRTKFGVVPQSFFQSQNPVQDEDQDHDHDFTLDFNTRPTFRT